MMSAPFNPRDYDDDGTTYFDPFYSCVMTRDHVEWFARKVSTVMTIGNPFAVGLGC